MNLGKYAGVAELADAPDLGSGGTPVQVQVLSPAPKKQSILAVLCFFGLVMWRRICSRDSSNFSFFTRLSSSEKFTALHGKCRCFLRQGEFQAFASVSLLRTHRLQVLSPAPKKQSILAVLCFFGLVMWRRTCSRDRLHFSFSS